MFDNENSKTNGEERFFNSMKSRTDTVFDVGSRSDSIFTDFHGNVHYFEPVPEFINALSIQPNKNISSHFNNFGLGNQTHTIDYYPKYQSFLNRTASCGVDDSKNKITLQIRKACDYIREKDIKRIDFLKIDTEGYELEVLKGFEESIRIVGCIQFEYGGTFLDNGVKLIDVIDYLRNFGFKDFSYVTPTDTHLIDDFSDHYRYCNIVCFGQI